MSDIATLQHNSAYSPRNHSATTTTTTLPSLHHNSIIAPASSSTNQPPPTHHPRSLSISELLVPHANGKRRTRRLSTPTEERKEQRKKKKKDGRPHNGGNSTEQPVSSSDDVRLHVATDLDADEHQWLLASAAANQKAAAQLKAEAEQCPLLIEPQQLIASSEDDMSPQLLSSPTFPSRPRVVDLVSSYEQLSFIRFPPRLTSLAVARYVWAAVGLMEVGWARAHEGETGSTAVWVNVVRGWQACWLVLCLCALVWSTAVEWTDDLSVPELDRVLLAVCWCVSVIAAVLVSHRILSQRLIGTRLYHLYHNAHPPHSSLSAMNSTLYSSLLGLLLLFAIGLYADLTSRTVSSRSSAETLDDAYVETARSSLWYACVCLLRLQLAAGVSLAICLLDVHRQRVEQSRAALMDSERCGVEDEDAICAHLLDVQLCVADLSDRIGAHVAAIVAASAFSALVMTLCALTVGGSVQLLALLSPLLLCLYVLVAAARLNQACSRLHSAVAVIALQPPVSVGAPSAVQYVNAAVSEGEGISAKFPRSSSTGSVRLVGTSSTASSFGASLRSFGWHRVSFNACGVRVDATVVCVFVLFWCTVLLWLMQTEHGR